MKICPHCNAQISDVAVFCNSCGRNVNLAPNNDAMPPQGNRNMPGNPAPSAGPLPRSGGPVPNTGMPQGQTMPQRNMTQGAPMNQNMGPNPNMGMNPNMAPNQGMAPNMGMQNPPMNQGMAPMRAPKNMDPKKKKKIMIIGGAAALGVIAIVIAIIVIISMSNAYRKPINDIISALNSQKMDTTAFAGYDYYQISEYDKSCRSIFSDTDYYEVWEEDMSDYYKDLYEDLEDRYGDNVKFSVEWEDADPMKKGDIREINEYLEEVFEGDETDWDNEDAYEDFADRLENIKYGAEMTSNDIKKLHDATLTYIKKIKTFKVTDGYEVDLKITIQGRDDEKTIKLRNAKIIKVDGNWIFADSGEKDSFSFGKHSTFGEQVIGDLGPYIR